MKLKIHGRLHVIFALIAIVLSTVSTSYGQVYTKKLAEGVTLNQQIISKNGNIKPLIVNAIQIDPKVKGVSVKAVIAGDQVYSTNSAKGRETVSSLAKRTGAVAALNADFFPFTGDMLNLHITDGELVSEPYPNRTVFGITKSGNCLFDTLGFNAKLTASNNSITINGLNRPCGKNEIVAYTNKFSPSTMTTGVMTEVVIKLSGKLTSDTPINGTIEAVNLNTSNTPINENQLVLSGSGVCGNQLKKLTSGDKVNLLFKIIPSKTNGWNNVVEAVGGGPRLISDGKITVLDKAEKFQASFASSAHPRSAVGVTNDGKIILAAVDGRQSISSGVGLKKLAEILLSYKCINAMNLDGGGSTSLANSTGIFNSPSEGSERPVANALAVIVDQPKPPSVMKGLSIAAITEPIESGTNRQLYILDGAGNPADKSVLEKAIWTTTGGAGFIDQSGRFYGIKAKKGIVKAAVGLAVIEAQIEVIPGKPATFNAELIPDPYGSPNRSLLKVNMADINKNPAKGVIVGVRVKNGVPDADKLTLDGKSGAETGITWDSNGSVIVTASGFNPITLNRK